MMKSKTNPEAISAQREKRAYQNTRPIFSFYEVARNCRTKFELKRESPGIASLQDTETIRDVYKLYQDKADLNFVPVLNAKSQIVGYLLRQMFMASLSQSQFSRDLLMRPEMTIASVMDPRVVVLDSYTTLSDASTQLMRREEDIRFDPFVVSHEGKYYGVSSIRRVLDGLNKYMDADMQACLSAQRRLMQGIDARNQKSDNFHAILQPLKGPGGDFVNYYNISERYKLLTLFDVCGKGIKAANMVMALGSLIESMLDAEARKESVEMNLQEIQLSTRLAQLNQLLYKITPEEMYATGVVVLIDYKKMLMQVLDFGHGMLWLKRVGKVYKLEDRNPCSVMPFLGIDPDLFLQATTYRIQSGDLLCTCSDGILEARNHAKEEFGLQRMQALLLELDNPRSMVDRIVERVAEFRDGFM